MSFLKCRKQNTLQKIVSPGASVLGNVIVIKSSSESLESLAFQLEFLGITSFYSVVESLQEAIEVAANVSSFSTIVRSTCSFKINYAAWAVHLAIRLKAAPQEVIAHGAIVERGLAKSYPGTIPKIKLTSQLKVTDVPAFSITQSTAKEIISFNGLDIMERISMKEGVYLVMYGEQYAIDKDRLDSGNMLSSRIKIDDFPYAKFKKPAKRNLTAVVYVTDKTVSELKKTIKCLQDNDFKTIIVTENVKIDLCDYSTHGNFLVKIQTIENRKEMGEGYSLFSAAINSRDDELIMFMRCGEVFERASIEFILNLITSDNKVVFGPAKKEMKSMITSAKHLKGLPEIVFDRISKTWKSEKLDWNVLRRFFESRGAELQQSTVVNLHSD